jgi:metal-sulfur cluster biosynthetic enzyme
MPPSDPLAEVWAALEPVTDPELDESVVPLGFIRDVAVEGDRVSVEFRLPTFWCSANFAYIMAEDMRDALAALPWIGTADIRLVDHFAAEKINDGIAARRGFSEVFGSEAADDLRAVRELFRRKSYLGRMSALIERLREGGKTAEEVLAMRIAELQLDSGNPLWAHEAHRFLERRSEFGGPAEPSDAAFRKPDGTDIAPDDLAPYLREIRMSRRSAEANGEMCRMLLKARGEFPIPAEERAFAG